MSYTIQYGPSMKAEKKRPMPRVSIFLVVVILAAAGAAARFLPEQLKHTLFPWSQPVVQEAFAEFRCDVREGEAFEDAFTAFCREILSHAPQVQ